MTKTENELVYSPQADELQEVWAQSSNKKANLGSCK